MEIRHRTLEFFLCGLVPWNSTRPIEKHIRWERPYHGWLKLNTDGSSLGNLGIAGGDDVVRDEHGNWVIGL